MLLFRGGGRIIIFLHQFFYIADRYIPAVFHLERAREHIAILNPAANRVLIFLEERAEIFDGEQLGSQNSALLHRNGRSNGDSVRIDESIDRLIDVAELL